MELRRDATLVANAIFDALLCCSHGGLDPTFRMQRTEKDQFFGWCDSGLGEDSTFRNGKVHSKAPSVLKGLTRVGIQEQSKGSDALMGLNSYMLCRKCTQTANSKQQTATNKAWTIGHWRSCRMSRQRRNSTKSSLSRTSSGSMDGHPQETSRSS